MRLATVAVGLAVSAAVFLLLCVGRERVSRPHWQALLSTQYWSQYFHDAPPYPRYGSAAYTGYPSYAAMPVATRRPSYYSSDVNVEEAIGLPTNIDDLNFETKDGKEAVAKMKDVIAAIACRKKIDKVEDEDRDRVDITDITPIPAVVTVSEVYPEQRKEGVRVVRVYVVQNAQLP
jgi:hypothetical protein